MDNEVVQYHHRAGRRVDPPTRKKFFEFFTVTIRNANIRAAHYRAIQQLAWAERAGYQHLEDIEPITVAAYIEILQHQFLPLWSLDIFKSTSVTDLQT